MAFFYQPRFYGRYLNLTRVSLCVSEWVKGPATTKKEVEGERISEVVKISSSSASIGVEHAEVLHSKIVIF